MVIQFRFLIMNVVHYPILMSALKMVLPGRGGCSGIQTTCIITIKTILNVYITTTWLLHAMSCQILWTT